MRLFRKKKKIILSSVIMIAMMAMLLPLSVAADEHGVGGDPFTPIYEIQGDGSGSDYHGDVVVTEGIVTVNLQKSSQLSGFFIALTGGLVVALNKGAAPHRDNASRPAERNRLGAS